MMKRKDRFYSITSPGPDNPSITMELEKWSLENGQGNGILEMVEIGGR
jgi:hypothetical protein